MKFKREILSQIGLSISMLTAMMIPLAPRILGHLLLFMTLNALLENNFRTRIRLIRDSIPNILLLAFYSYNLIGLLWSTNVNAGLAHLETKLSFLILPFVIFAEPLRKIYDIKKTKLSFIIGCVFSFFICTGRALISYFQDGVNHFTYSQLSGNIHPSYLSMYCLMAICFLWFDYIEPQFNKALGNLFYPIASATLLVVFTIMLSSKINIILLTLLLASLIIYVWIKKKNTLHSLIITILIAGIPLAIFYLLPSISNRMEKLTETVSSSQHIKHEDTESNAARILVWNAGMRLYTEHILFGVGTGDVNDLLIEQYQKMNYTGVYNKRLNAHNQFLQTAIAIGLFGVFILAAIFLIFFREGSLLSDYNLLIFTTIFFFNSLVEGTLETQAGVIFFVFFATWLLPRKTT